MRLENLKGVMDHPRHEFVKGDIADPVVDGPLARSMRGRSDSLEADPRS